MSRKVTRQNYKDPISLLTRFMMRDEFLAMKDPDLYFKMRQEYGEAIGILVKHELEKAAKVLEGRKNANSNSR